MWWYVRLLVWSVLLAALACMAVVLYMSIDTQRYIFTDSNAAPTTEVAMVLGASIENNGTLSPVLQERADKALELYNAHKVLKILVTGDNSSLNHDEVDPVGKYLVAHGVPQSAIFLDHAGFDTYSSMYRARDVFAVKTVTIVSQPFHLPRAVFIARALGLDAYGASAGKGEEFLYNYAREIPASLKAAVDLAIVRKPEYLGSQFPIQGSGVATWSVSTTTIK